MGNFKLLSDFKRNTYCDRRELLYFVREIEENGTNFCNILLFILVLWQTNFDVNNGYIVHQQMMIFNLLSLFLTHYST